MVTAPHHPEIVLVRHGETAWTISGQHTGSSDIPLTEAGRRQAEELAPRLAGRRFDVVLTSPLGRALETCRLAGVGEAAEVSEDVLEWDYGTYDGRTTAEIRTEHPDWSLWTDGAPEGERAAQVGARADRVIARLLGGTGDAVVFSHGHFLRVLATRWLALAPEDGRLFALAPASVSILGWEREQRVLTRWNETVAVLPGLE